MSTLIIMLYMCNIFDDHTAEIGYHVLIFQNQILITSSKKRFMLTTTADESDAISDDKRAKIFRYGRAPGVFRYGKRAPSVFRYGKRAPAVFRYGRRSDDADDGMMMLVEPHSAIESAGHNKRKIFRYGKRSAE